MKSARELYPEEWEIEQKNGSFYEPEDYQPMIEEIGNILLQVDDYNYQGDSRVMFEKGGKYGYLIFGWGSCSGCDSLKACRTIKDIQQLFDRMVADTKWFNSIEELKNYFRRKDWEFEHCWYDDGEKTREFVQKVIDYIS